jgi:hypothetical protein
MAAPKLSSPPSEPSDSVPSPSVETRKNQHVDPGAKNPVVSSPEMDDSTPKTQKTQKQSLQTMNIDVEVKNCVDVANGAQVLWELLCALTKMNKSSSILLLNSKSDNNKIDGKTIFPEDPKELKAFVLRYFGGLRLTSNFLLKGKITVRTYCKFPALIQNKDVQKFLKGAWSETKPTPVTLLLHTLECIARTPVGLFLNTFRRKDMVQSMSQRIRGWVSDVKDFPPIQVEMTVIFRGKLRAEYLRILAAEKDVKAVEKALLQLFPEPSAKMSFIPSATWRELDSKRKTYYHQMHLQFQDIHSSFLLRGVRDSSVEITMEPKSVETLSVYNWIKCNPLFVRVEPPLPSGDLELLCAAADRAEAQKWISTALQQIGQRATAASFEKIFLQPAKVIEQMNSNAGPTKPPAAKARAFKATGGRAGATPATSCESSPNLTLYQEHDKSHDLLLPRAKTQSAGKKKSIPRGKTRGTPKGNIAFYLVPPVPTEPSPSGDKFSGEPSASDVPLAASKKRPKKRRQRKKKKEPESVDLPVPSPSHEPSASIPVAPTPVVSAVAAAAMDVGEDDDATTTSVKSTRSNASVIGTQVSPTEVTRETEPPSPGTASGESSKYKSAIAALESEVAKLKEQLATQPRDPPEVRTTAETVISDPSSLTASTPDADLLAGAALLFPPRILYGTQAMHHVPPSYDLPPPSKRSRQSALIDTQSAPVAGPPDEDDADDFVNTAASQVSNLTLDHIPRSLPSESGMPL